MPRTSMQRYSVAYGKHPGLLPHLLLLNNMQQCEVSGSTVEVRIRYRATRPESVGVPLASVAPVGQAPITTIPDVVYKTL